MNDILIDRLNIKDDIGNGPKGVLYSKNKTLTGKTIFKKLGENKITIGLSQQLMCWWTNTDLSTNITTLDNESGFDPLPIDTTVDLTPRLFGFGLSIDGGSEGVVNPVYKYTKGYNFTTDYSEDGIVPIRLLTSGEDESGMYPTYCLRRVDGDSRKAYYIKKFDNVDTKNIDEDGLSLPNNPEESLSGDVDVYSVIDLDITITQDDLKEYFGLVEEDVNFRRYNAITLFMGHPVDCTLGGATVRDYRDVFACNRLNLKQKNLGEEGEQELLYRIYL